MVGMVRCGSEGASFGECSEVACRRSVGCDECGVSAGQRGRAVLSAVRGLLFVTSLVTRPICSALTSPTW